MRVLHIGKFFAPFKGGVETYLLDAMRALQRNDVQCAALVHDHRRGWRASDERLDAGQAAIRVMRVATWAQLFFTPVSPGFRAGLQRMLREFKPDLIHVHLPNPSAFWLLTSSAARRLPLVVHWHSDVITTNLGPAMRLLYRVYRPFERKLLKRAHAIIATSESYLASSESLADFPDKCRVIPLGLDANRLLTSGPARPRLPLPGRDLQVLSIGRLTYYKGFGYLVKAIAETPGVQLHIVGDGDLRHELEGLARQLELGDRVIFHGALDDRQLAARLMDCDCLCLASVERTEAFGLVLLESMCFARAAVASRVSGSGMSWVVQDGVTGLTVPPRDSAALAAALATLRDNPELVRDYGANGRARFERSFTIGHSASALTETYRRVLGQAGP